MNADKKNIIYLFYYDFDNTKGNHAGMSYLVTKLAESYSNIRLIKAPNSSSKLSKIKLGIFYIYWLLYLKIFAKPENKILLFEYLTKGAGYQDMFLKYARFIDIKGSFTGLIHLSGDNLLELYNSKELIKNKTELLDCVWTLGSSLTDFLLSIGVEKEIKTTFHYVDVEFYQFTVKDFETDTLQVICMGSLKRNFERLKRIIVETPELSYNLCMGKNDLSHQFKDVPNVKLYSFLSENELLGLMRSSHLSLSVIDDTIGSNVITTSLSTGLVQVVSDVGSIRNYCSEFDSFLCKDDNDFITTLRYINKNRDILHKMSVNSNQKAHKISLKAFIEEFLLLLQ